MAATRATEKCPTWKPKLRLTSEIQLHLCGSIFTIDKVLLASKSSRISRLLQKHPKGDLSHLLPDIPADLDSMELVGRFCHGFDISLTTQNVVRVACLTHYLGMTDTHCPNNLFSRAVSFFELNVVASWNNSINALKSSEPVLPHALHLGLVDYCVDSLISKALETPRLLGDPLDSSSSSSDDEENENQNDNYKPNARRKLFDLDWKSEDLTSLSLRLYAPVIHAMSQRRVPPEYIAANLFNYAKTWLFNSEDNEEKSRKEILETVSALLPAEKYLVPCGFLSEMLKLAIGLDASADCVDGLEMRIGKQLDRAEVRDLLIPARGYARAEKYDTECIRRILKNFYGGYEGSGSDAMTSFGMVSELIDDFLAEISSDIDLKASTFVEIADMSVAASTGSRRTSDGIYRALDIYLDKHGHLTEGEREMVCKVLDCNKMSAEACEHAARNERLPVRVVVQVLFVVQLKLREAIPSEAGVVVVGTGAAGEEVKAEMEKMGCKVMELERECGVMKREIERGGVGKGKGGVWREMKRKLGCVTSSMHDCNCHVKNVKKKKKVHPR